MNLGQAVDVVQERCGRVVDECLGHRLVGHPGQNLLLRPQADVPRLKGELGVRHDWSVGRENESQLRITSQGNRHVNGPRGIDWNE